jgi:hypothetical protein
MKKIINFKIKRKLVKYEKKIFLENKNNLNFILFN